MESTVIKSSQNSITPTRISSAKLINLKDVAPSDYQRESSNISELDRVLGGGFVPGQVIMLAGEPGVGKSTLLTQLAKSLDKSNKQVFYVCGEESVSQIKIRTTRMGYDGKNMTMLPETDVDAILGSLYSSSMNISLVIVDSIQMLYTSDVAGLGGSLSQIRASAAKLIEYAKKQSIPVILVGHVTKEGVIAGPKVLEHMVDTVLYLEGDSQHMFRILKASKNRFGPVSEVGIFEMNELGMTEVLNPSELFLEDQNYTSPGTCVTAIMEGYRPILFEVQALTVKSAFGFPKRTTSGFSMNRLQLLLAILEKRCGLHLGEFDVYLNIAGGYKVTEYSADLAVCIAVSSSVKGVPVKNSTVAFGECSLSGFLRKVTFEQKRTDEAKKLGYKNVISASKTKRIDQAVLQALESK